MLHAIASAFIGVAAFISSLFGASPTPVQDLGAALPSGTAVFETSLQSRISSTDTSMTLVSNSVRGGSTLSGYQCFTLDEGRTDSEYVCGSVSGTSVTALERGVDPSTGTTTNSALKFAHRVGADVKITDYPLIQRLRSVANGTDTFPNPLIYQSHPCSVGSATTTICDKNYVDNLAFSGAGVIDASTVSRGVVEIATQIEAASSTAQGSSGVLALAASSATSTWNALTAPLRVLVTDNNGFLDQGFLPATISKTLTFSGATTVSGDFNVTGTNNVHATSTTYNSSGTWVKPTYGNVVHAECWGGGGGGGRGTVGGGGGAGGNYSDTWIPFASTASSETVTIGAAGTGATSNNTAGVAGGDSSFGSWLSAYGGGAGLGDSASGGGGGGGGALTAGSTAASGTGAAGGSPSDGVYHGGAAGGSASATTGGTGSNGFYGGGGGGGSAENDGGSTSGGGPGGNSKYGGGGGAGTGFNGAAAGGTSQYGGAGGAGSSGATAAGSSGTQPGGGGGGGRNANGGSGAKGSCRITVFF